MMRLAEKRSEVRRDGVAELHELGAAVRLQELAILAKRPEIERTQAPGDPRVHELALGLGEIDPRDLLDERAQRLEVLLAKGELAQALRVHRLAQPGANHAVFPFYSLSTELKQLDGTFARMAPRPGVHQLVRVFRRGSIAQRSEAIARVRQLLHQPVVKLQILDAHRDFALQKLTDIGQRASRCGVGPLLLHKAHAVVERASDPFEGVAELAHRRCDCSMARFSSAAAASATAAC